MMKANIQDYNLVEAYVNAINDRNSYDALGKAFMVFAVKELFDISEDEIDEHITDTSYVGNHKGDDRGIDAIVIIEDEDKSEIHFLNCKYVISFAKSKNNHFPSNEIDKILSFFNDLFSLEIDNFNNSNNVLNDKVIEIMDIIQGPVDSYSLHLHFVSNSCKGLVPNENSRLMNSLSSYKRLDFSEIMLEDLSEKIVGKDKMQVNAKVQYSLDDGFIRTDGNSRALIFSINAISLLSMVSKDVHIRDKAILASVDNLADCGIEEDAFDLNVRKYQKKRNRVNKNIVETCISEDRKKVFYYNNGVTVICEKFKYGDVQNTVLEIDNLQIVNGCQTVHCLFDALRKDSEKLNDVDILCKLYEIRNEQTCSKISEYTNSQTRITGRDLKSNDSIQIKLERQFNAKGYTYERKKIQHKPSDDLSQVLDNEKIGQLLMAYNNEMPGKAKNSKSLIFGKEYDNLFRDDITADEILDILKIHNMIEKSKIEIEEKMKDDDDLYSKYNYIIYATYYILFSISLIKKMNRGINTDSDFDKHYQIATDLIEKYLSAQKQELKTKFSASSVFKNQGLKDYIIMNSKELIID